MSSLKVNDTAVAFVSDWKKRTSEQQKKYIILSIGMFILASVICILVFFWFQDKNYKRIVAQNKQYIQDSALQEANQVEREMLNAQIQIQNLSNQYANLVKFSNNTTIIEKLTYICDKNLFDRIAFIEPDGSDTSLEGTAYVGDREYFQDGMKGNSGWELLEKSRVTGKATVIFYSPVIVDDEIVGVMAGFYEQQRLTELFSYQLFKFTPNTYLLLGDGTLVATSNPEPPSNNLMNELSHKQFIDDVDYNEILAAIADTERTSISFSFVDNHATYVGVLVQFNNSDWMLLSVLPHTITGDMVNNANRIGTILLIAIVLVFLLLTFILVFFLTSQAKRLDYEMSIATANLESAVEEEAKQLTIIESLVGIYSSVYYIDLEKSEYQRIKELEPTAHDLSLGETGDAATGFNAYIDKLVDPSAQELLYHFLDITTFRQRMKENGSEYIEYLRQDKSWRRATLVSAGRNDEGELVSVVFAVQKIDQEKQAELETMQALQEAYDAAQVANNAKTTFLSNMSHDIRTPMNAIVGMTAIAAANLENTEKVSDCLKKITSSSKHLLGLINEVLDMSKIESGKVDLCEEEFSLSDLMDNLISINQPLIKEKNHTLLVKINNLKHEKVIGDSTRLQQVFTNLLSNSIKYTPENGKIEITISEKETNKSTIGWYEIIFKDNGLGMTEEFQQNLFEPFSRAMDSRITHIQGTGLGMPIAKNIVNMMNGDITVKSKLNEGSTFTVSFALKLQTETEVNYEEFVDLPILVVDDDVTACESTCTILDSLSMKSEWVTSGREAVEKTVEHHEKENDYYAVIIDWKMPDMNGIETAKEIRRRVSKDIPIIVMTAYDWSDIEHEAKAAGVNAFLSKPLFKSRLVGLFSELLNGKTNEGSEQNVKETLQKADFSGKRILLVEDNEINREIAVELFSMSGLQTETAENGKIGVEMFAASRPGYYDLIFMDIQMPVMNGYDAAMAIRALSHPDAAKVPIIAMTANAFASDVRAAYNAGMNGHIAKPIDINFVIKTLNEHIG